MKRLLALGFLASFVVAAVAMANGPYIHNLPQATATACSGGNTQVFTADPNNVDSSLCEEVNVSAATSCGDISTSATSGSLIAANSSKTYCVNDNIYCCGTGGSSTIQVIQSRRTQITPTATPT
jgi:hypothetical protein